MYLKSIIAWFVFVGLSFLAGTIGASVTAGQISGWYAELAKPSWTPPSWVFSPVWTALYLLMGTAAALVWNSRRFGRLGVAWFFIAHLGVNALWSVAFFGLEELWLSLWVIFVLFVSVGLLTLMFLRFSKLAALLMVPYLLWVSFAMVLNAAIAFMN